MAIFRSLANGHIRRDIGHTITSRISLAGASLANVRRRATLPMSAAVLLSGIFLLGGLLMGIFITTQWQARSSSALSGAAAPITRQSDREMVASTISRLEAEQARLKQQIADLRGQVNNTQGDTLQGTNGKGNAALIDADNAITQQRIEAGMVALRGPGIKVTLDDSIALEIPENEDPANYILHEYDLRDVLNALWIAGAEAVSLNGERIVSNTSLYCVGTTVICNATRLSPPYVLRAIGKPEALSDALKKSTQMEKLNQRARIYDLPITIEMGDDVAVPAYNGSFVFKYANAQDGE